MINTKSSLQCLLFSFHPPPPSPKCKHPDLQWVQVNYKITNYDVLVVVHLFNLSPDQTTHKLTEYSTASGQLRLNTPRWQANVANITLQSYHTRYNITSLHLSHSLVDRWGTKDDRATTVLHSSLFSAFRRASPSFNPVHSVTLSSHIFFCLPLLFPPCTVPCRIIFASPVDLVLCPYHLSLRFFTMVRRSS